MMEQNESLLKILTYKLPGAVTRPLFAEYNNRLNEIANIWSYEKSAYRVLQDYKSVIGSLLAMSLFYRHVLGHLQGANSFYKTLNQRSGLETECRISIGRTVLDKKQQGQLEAIRISFNKIQDKYQLYPAFYEFSETAQFLKNCKDLLSIPEYEEDNSI